MKNKIIILIQIFFLISCKKTDYTKEYKISDILRKKEFYENDTLKSDVLYKNDTLFQRIFYKKGERDSLQRIIDNLQPDIAD